MPEQRLKIAVFIDFDNIEIGVKNTLNAQFDIGVVLEALKERGDVVSKTAYGDWTRAGDYSRSLTQHATKLVQRNLTPGGDKNGADINHVKGIVSMARGDDPASATTSFFIVMGPAPSLDGKYTVFGRVADGMDVVDRIDAAPVNGEAPVTRIDLLKVRVINQ